MLHGGAGELRVTLHQLLSAHALFLGSVIGNHVLGRVRFHAGPPNPELPALQPKVGKQCRTGEQHLTLATP